MIALILTLCASAAMDSCEVHSLGQFQSPQQCETVAGVHREILGAAPNYRIECAPE